MVQNKQAKTTAKARRQVSVAKVIWAIEIVCRYVIPFRNCLTRALATQTLLARYGHVAELRIGVVKTEIGKIKAHAWIENEGKVLVGHVADLALYTPLLPLKRAGL